MNILSGMHIILRYIQVLSFLGFLKNIYAISFKERPFKFTRELAMRGREIESQVKLNEARETCVSRRLKYPYGRKPLLKN